MNERPDANKLLVWASAFYGALLLLAWFVSMWSGLPLRRLAEPWATWEMAPAAVVGALCGLALVALSRVFTARTRAGAALAEGLRSLLPPLARSEAWLLALVSGVAEETLFRGALQPWLGLIPSAILFGAAHFVPRAPFAVWTLFAVFAGFCFGALYLATGHLVAPIAAHVVVNGLNLYWLHPKKRGA